MSILIDDDKIIKVADNKAIENCADIPSNINVIDMNGQYVLPGLVNMRVHLAATGSAPKKNVKPINYKKLYNILTRMPLVMKIYKHIQQGNAKNELYVLLSVLFFQVS